MAIDGGRSFDDIDYVQACHALYNLVENASIAVIADELARHRLARDGLPRQLWSVLRVWGPEEIVKLMLDRSKLEVFKQQLHGLCSSHGFDCYDVDEFDPNSWRHET